MNLARYRKTLVAVAGAVATAIAAALTDGTFTPAEGVGVVLAVLTVLGVYATPNAQPPGAVETWVEKRLATDEGNRPRR